MTRNRLTGSRGHTMRRKPDTGVHLPSSRCLTEYYGLCYKRKLLALLFGKGFNPEQSGKIHKEVFA